MRRFFREVLSLCLVLAMLTVGCMAGLCEEAAASAEETKAIAFEPTLTKVFDYSAQEWFSSSANRALLTIMLAVDLDDILDENMFAPGTSLVNTTFVAKDSVSLIVCYHAEQNDLFVVYMPIIGTATYQFMDKSSDISTRYALEAIADDGYYENNLEDIVEVMKILQEVLENS